YGAPLFILSSIRFHLKNKVGNYVVLNHPRVAMTKQLHFVAGFVLAVVISLSALAAAETGGEAGLDARVVELYRMGRISEAIPLAERGLEISEEALGPDHPDVARSLDNLAKLLPEPRPLRRRRAVVQTRAGDGGEDARP